jgi:hypothetical protein
VWLDENQASVASASDGRPRVTEIFRGLELEPHYLLRVARETADYDRLVVMGPDVARLAFEREYVALYHRPDRLIDAGAERAPRSLDLVDRLRLIDPSLFAVGEGAGRGTSLVS